MYSSNITSENLLMIPDHVDVYISTLIEIKDRCMEVNDQNAAERRP